MKSGQWQGVVGLALRRDNGRRGHHFDERGFGCDNRSEKWGDCRRVGSLLVAARWFLVCKQRYIGNNLHKLCKIGSKVKMLNVLNKIIYLLTNCLIHNISLFFLFILAFMLTNAIYMLLKGRKGRSIEGLKNAF